MIFTEYGRTSWSVPNVGYVFTGAVVVVDFGSVTVVVAVVIDVDESDVVVVVTQADVVVVVTQSDVVVVVGLDVVWVGPVVTDDVGAAVTGGFVVPCVEPLPPSRLLPSPEA